MNLENENINEPQNPQLNKCAISGSGFTRLDLGEAWMWCSDCMNKLYSFDGSEDSSRKCPHPQKCAYDRNRTKNHYR